MTEPFEAREPYGEPLGTASHFCREYGGRVYCERAACPWCGVEDA